MTCLGTQQSIVIIPATLAIQKTSLPRVPADMLASVLVCGFFSMLQIHNSDTTDDKFYSFAAFCAHCLQHGLRKQRLLGPLELSELEI